MSQTTTCQDCGHQVHSLESKHVNICEDCGHLGLLAETPACADYQYQRDLCCIKMVCSETCVYKCPQGHVNLIQNSDGEISEAVCHECSVKWIPPHIWYGISIAEYLRRNY